MIGDVQTQLGAHQEAIRCFKEILETRPEELGVLVALSRGLLALAKEETSAGYHARAEGSLLESLAAVKVLLDGKGFRALAWKQVADVCLHLSQLSFAFDQDAVSAVLSPLIKMLSSEDNGNNASIPDVVSIRQLSASSPTFDAATVLRLSVCAYAYRHHLLLGDDVTSAAASHDIAVALHHFGTTLPAADSELKQKVVREAVLAVKVALRVQPRNEQLWVTLGTLAFETSARLSQHAFVMAIEINPKVSQSLTPFSRCSCERLF
jgi:superkiller protein 3